MKEQLKFKKKKERERAVRKKILLKRSISRKEAAEARKKWKLEKIASKLVKEQEKPDMKAVLEKIEETPLRGESNLEFAE
jgi:hypothetical protein